jgi:PHD/YefM family antitoxin component YafN of YafNO toxin-antitoxin module
MATSAMPRLDPDVKHVGVSKLRDLNATKLKDDQGTIYVLQDNDQPLAVLLSYERYLIIQEQLASVMNALEMLSDPDERKGLMAGIQEVRNGRTRSFLNVKADLREKYGDISDTDQTK